MTFEIELEFDKMKAGKHGFHLNEVGNELNAPQTECVHYNPEEKEHGALNSPMGHRGDFGNLTFKLEGEHATCKARFLATQITLKEMFGRSLVIDDREDDLGRGNHVESKKTGNSGPRMLWGIVAVN